MNLNLIYDTLKTALDKVTEINQLDWYLEQDKVKGGIIYTPAVFLNFSDVLPSEVNKYKRQLEFKVEVIVFTKYLNPSSKISTNNVHFLVENRIDEELSYLQMTQTGFEPLKKEGKLRRSSLTYTHKFVQDIPQKPRTNTIQSSEIEPVISIEE